MNSIVNEAFLADTLDRYAAHFKDFLSRADAQALPRLDAAFAALRSRQRESSPALSQAVVDLGLAGCDAINAMEGAPGISKPQLAALVDAHERLVGELRDRLCAVATY